MRRLAASQLDIFHVSAINECKLCHNPGSHSVLGFVPNQLSTTPDNAQLDSLVRQGVLTEEPELGNGRFGLVQVHFADGSVRFRHLARPG